MQLQLNELSTAIPGENIYRYQQGSGDGHEMKVWQPRLASCLKDVMHVKRRKTISWPSQNTWELLIACLLNSKAHQCDHNIKQDQNGKGEQEQDTKAGPGDSFPSPSNKFIKAEKGPE